MLKLHPLEAFAEGLDPAPYMDLLGYTSNDIGMLRVISGIPNEVYRALYVSNQHVARGKSITREQACC